MNRAMIIDDLVATRGTLSAVVRLLGAMQDEWEAALHLRGTPEVDYCAKGNYDFMRFCNVQELSCGLDLDEYYHLLSLRHILRMWTKLKNLYIINKGE